MAKQSGELWISDTTPHVLKYQAGSTEYWTNAAITYVASEAIAKGQILAIDDATSAVGKVRLAEYPKDLNDIIGIALNSGALNDQIRVLNYGYMEFDRAELEALFVTQSDITVGAIDADYYTGFGTMTDGGAGNGWNTSTYDGKGAPVYWYSGRLLKTAASTYAMQQPVTFKGKLTLSTPSGYNYPAAVGPAWGDNDFDVAYEGLPTIGNVHSYTRDGTDVDTLILHVNFAKFQKRVSFSYPSSGLYHYEDDGATETTYIRHGLFTNSSLVPHTNVEIIGSTDDSIDGEIIMVHPGFTSDRAASASFTSVDVTSDSDFYGKIVGEIRYSL